MKNFRLLITIALLAGTVNFSVYAGTRTHVRGDGETYDQTFYLKDDGTYAKNEWIQDTNGKFYYVEGECIMDNVWGIASDGRLYKSDGELVPMEDGRKFVTLEDIKCLQTGMSYEQVASILGKEHELLFYDVRVIDDETGETEIYVNLVWYCQDNENSINATFINGALELAFYGPRKGLAFYIVE